MTENPTDPAKPAKNGAPPCPICGAKMVLAFRPFCSARCKDIDLHRWLSGTYVIPGRPGGDEESEVERPVPPPEEEG